MSTKKTRLYKALKEEMEAKAALKVAQRKQSRATNRAYDNIVHGTEEKRAEVKRQKLLAKAEEEEERKQGIAERKTQRKELFTAKQQSRKDAKGDIQDLLHRLYTDEDTGFGSRRELYEQAKSHNDLVTMKDVQDYFSKEAKKEAPLQDYKGDNSFVASLPRQQYQVDVGYINKGITQDIAEGQEGHFLVSRCVQQAC